MAVLRGQTIASELSESRLKRIEQLKKKLIATKTPDKPALQLFLDEAGGVELADLGKAFSLRRSNSSNSDSGSPDRFSYGS